MTKNILKRLSSLWLAIIMVIMIIPATAVTVSAVNVGDMVPIMGMSVDGLYAERTYYDTTNQGATIGSDYINLNMKFSQDSCGDTSAYNTDLYIKLYNAYSETAVISFDTSGVIRVEGTKYSDNRSFFVTLAPDACVTLSITSDLFSSANQYLKDINTSIKNIKVTKGAQKTITETVTPYASNTVVYAGTSFTVGYHGLVSAPASVFTPQFRLNGTEEWTDQRPTATGTYDIRGYCPSSLEYTECYTQIATRALIITKSSSAPTIVFPTASTSPAGGETDTLASVVLTGGSTELGTFAWQAPDTAVSVGSHEYTMVFTPSEEAKAAYNFTSDTITRQVTVKGVKRHQTPEAETDYINGGLKNLFPGADYVLSHKELTNDNIISQYLTADANGKVAFAGTVGTWSEYSLVRAGDGASSFDSLPQKFKFVAPPSSPETNITYATSYDSNDGKIAISEPDPNCRYFYLPDGAGFADKIEFTSTGEATGLAAGRYTIYIFYPDAAPMSFLQYVKVAPVGSPIAVSGGNNIKLNKGYTGGDTSLSIERITDAELILNSFTFANGDIFSFTSNGTSSLTVNYAVVVGMIHVKAGLDEGVYEDDLIITYDTNKTYRLKIRLTVGTCSGHTYSTFKSNKNGTHSSNCDKCGDTATWDCVGGFANCQSAAVCKACKTAYGTTDKTKHSTFAWRYTDTTHEYYCTRCEDVEISGTHGNYNNYTPDGNGSHTKACECGKTFTESCYGHSGDCTTVLKCACTYTLAENTAHTGGEATCTKVAECELCHTEYGTVDLTNHNATKNGGTPADCCTSGIKDSWHCADCGKDFAEASCTTDITGNLTDPATGNHIDNDPWMTDGAKHWRICDVGGTKYAEGEHIPGPAATEQAPQICTTCEYVLADQLEHKHSFGEVAEEEFKVSNATCLESAVYYRSCACGEKSTETFKVGEPDAAKHTGTNDKLVSDNAGKHNVVWTCCGEIFDENVVCTPTTLDGSCLTAEICSCGYVTKVAETSHDFNTELLSDAEGHYHKCKNCDAIDEKIKHSAVEDGDCTTEERCSCGTLVFEAKPHSFDNACDTACNNDGCTHTRTTEHTPEDDDGDCTTDILCSVCDAVTTKGNEAHTGGTATCTAKAECSVCGTKYGSTLAHTFTVPEKDSTDHWNKCSDCDAIDEKIKHSATEDGDCTTEERCSCGTVMIEAKSHSFDNACDTTCNNDGCTHTRTTEHTPEDDDGDCTTDILCSVCDAVTTKGNESHTGGTATCTAKAECSVCGTAYGELDANNHSKTTFVYTANENGTTHTGKYECCGVVADSEAHSYGADNTCVCGAEKPLPAYTVTVENGTASDGNTSILVNENGSVTVTANAAPEGKQFKGWSVNGTVVSTAQSYTFNATADTTITAVYEDIPKNSGCGSAIGIDSSVIVLALIGIAVFFIRKRKKAL